MRMNKTVLVLMLVALAAMFVWSFVYRAANPSLVASLNTQSSQTSGQGEQGGQGAMGSMGGPAMKAVVEAMAKIKENPEDVDALRHGAEAFASAEMWERAGQLVDRALVKAPDDPELLNLSGVVLFRLERPAEAAKKFERLLELDKGNVHAQFNLGAVYKYGLQDTAKAKALFEAVIANPKADPETKAQARDELAPGS